MFGYAKHFLSPTPIRLRGNLVPSRSQWVTPIEEHPANTFQITGESLGAQAARLHWGGQETHAEAFQPILVGFLFFAA
jgi:hypothetical protein